MFFMQFADFYFVCHDWLFKFLVTIVTIVHSFSFMNCVQYFISSAVREGNMSKTFRNFEADTGKILNIVIFFDRNILDLISWAQNCIPTNAMMARAPSFFSWFSLFSFSVSAASFSFSLSFSLSLPSLESLSGPNENQDFVKEKFQIGLKIHI